MGLELIEVLEAFKKLKRISCSQLEKEFGMEVSKHLATLVDQELIVVDTILYGKGNSIADFDTPP